LLPYFFRPDRGAYWGLWGADETTMYLGIAPLMLALVALLHLRSRIVLLLGLVALASLILALGDYLPIKLYGLIWSLPGFSMMRVPARFGLFFVLAGALLSGYGADWLARRPWRNERCRRPGTTARLWWLVLCFALGALVIGGLFLFARAWIEANSSAARALIDDWYLKPRRGDWRLNTSTVYFGLLGALDLSNPRTIGALALMVGASAWLLLRGLGRLPGSVWRVGLLALVTADLTLFAQSFYAQKPVGALKLSSPAVRFLAEHNGLHRVFIEPILFSHL